jgi:hypothetical protein
MRELVKHHEQLSGAGQSAIDGDKVATLDAVVKTIGSQRHLDDRYFETSTKTIKILFRKRALIPSDTKLSDRFEV